MAEAWTREALAAHLAEHDIEAPGLSTIKWHYDDPQWWSMSELRAAHALDHGGAAEGRQVNHSHSIEEVTDAQLC